MPPTAHPHKNDSPTQGAASAPAPENSTISARTVIGATMQPGQKGTRGLLRSYGDQLVCVRYRYDKARGKRYKTVELIIDEQDWQQGVTIPPDKRVLLEIGFSEEELREKVKASGGSGTRKRNSGRSGSVQFGVITH